MLQELSTSETDAVLYRNFLGRIGYHDGDHIYIVPVFYYYKDNSLLCRSYEGQKVIAMRRQPEVCFEVEEIRSFDHWQTVLCQGHFEEITDPTEIEAVRRRLSEETLNKKASLSGMPPAESKESQSEVLPHVIYYRIRIAEKSGRAEQPL